ncbi:hypothetical protein K504DRAFT_508970 [Pleomassaria siparia CBS 279.74]|uniref:Uncharacterized protein n=1 Tax=Pleomassaria siparia CBS 279.74 TaxID=1314801 RepID=A0A6G1JPG9_9PLEO|nr:hypothetical protein K504DRAFT_508970 [Pleomassaria siparia CBS 279.74]
MLKKAKAIGNTTAAAHAQLFLQAWQARRSPVVRAISGPLVLSPSKAVGTSTAVKPYSFSALSNQTAVKIPQVQSDCD